MNLLGFLNHLKSAGLGNNFLSRSYQRPNPTNVDYKAPGYNPGMDAFPTAPNATGYGNPMAGVGMRPSPTVFNPQSFTGGLLNQNLQAKTQNDVLNPYMKTADQGQNVQWAPKTQNDVVSPYMRTANQYISGGLFNRRY